MIVCLLAGVTFAMLPASAYAVMRTLDFDDGGSGPLKTRYEAQGLVLGDGPAADDGPVPQTVSAPGRAFSGSTVLSGAGRCQGGEFPKCTNLLLMRLVKPTNAASMRLGMVPQVTTCSNKMIFHVEAIDGAGGTVADLFVPVTFADRFEKKATFNMSSRVIAFLRVSGPSTGCGIAIDHLRFDFDAAAPPPVPIFGLDWQRLRGVSDLVVAPGTSSDVKLIVTRGFGSAGPIAYRVKQKPPGVEATIHDPNPTDANEVTVTISAQQGTAPQSAAPLIIAGAPSSPAVAVGERTVTIPITTQMQFDTRIDWLEPTQGVQEDPPQYSSSDSGLYRGVPFAAHRTTYVRLGVGAHEVVDGLASIPGRVSFVPGGSVLLYGYRGTKPLPGSPLSPIVPFQGFRGGFQNSRTRDVVTFALPPEWDDPGEILLQARIRPPGDEGLNLGGAPRPALALCRTPICVRNDTFGVVGVPFRKTIPFLILPVPLTYTRWNPVTGVNDTFAPTPSFDAMAYARALIPTADDGLVVFPDRATQDVSDLANIDQLSAPTRSTADEEAALEQAKRDEWVDRFRTTFTIGGLTIVSTPYAAGDFRDGGNFKNDLMTSYMDAWEAANRPPTAPGTQVVLGLNAGAGRGAIHRVKGITVTEPRDPGLEIRVPRYVGIAGTNRPITAVAHEIMHALELGHAGTNCPGIGQNGQTGEAWPPEERGVLDGIGLDTTQPFPFPVVAPLEDGRGGEIFDTMSYCVAQPLERNSWVAPRNWHRMLDRLSATLASAAASSLSASRSRTADTQLATTSQAPLLRVSAVGYDGAAVVTTVAQVVTGDETRQSAHVLVARDAAGNEVARALMSESRNSEGGGTQLVGYVPARSVASVEVVHAGAVIGSRTRSPAIPRVTLVAPRARQTIGRSPTVTVKWQARDTDRDQLQARIDYSDDAGASWRTVYTGPSRGTASLPSRYFNVSHRARVRVVVNDGFNEASATSRLLQAIGARPTVRIIEPRADAAPRTNDARIALRAQAFDDDARMLKGKALRWYRGRRLIGTGAAASVGGLPPGTHRIKLRATDGRGRSSIAFTTVRLRGVAPAFLLVGAAEHVGTRVRNVVLRVTTTLPSRLTVSGPGARRAVRAAVGREQRSVFVPIKPGTGPLVLSLRLSAYGRTIRRTLTIPRP